MKTIKTKKSVGVFYVLSCCIDGKLTPHVYNTRECADKSRSWAIKENLQPSEISEVALFETVEEQVPEVVARWYFAYIRGESSDMYITTIDDNEWLEKKRARLIKEGYLCSEIKLLREEF